MYQRNVFCYFITLNFNRLTQFSLPWFLATNVLVVSVLHCILKTRANLHGTTFASNCSMPHFSSQNAKIVGNLLWFCIVHGYDFREVFKRSVFKVLEHVCSSRKQVVPYCTTFLFSPRMFCKRHAGYLGRTFHSKFFEQSTVNCRL